MEIARTKSGIVVSQRKYTLDLFRETGMISCKPSDTPMDQNTICGREGWNTSR